jgi:hypothetical protein
MQPYAKRITGSGKKHINNRRKRMSQQNPKRTQKQFTEAIKKELGIERLEEFRRADLTSELREKIGLTSEDEFRLMAVADLHRLGLPVEVAEALGLSGALGSASELQALQAEEVEQILNEAPVKRLIPANFEINLELIEQWLQQIQPLTAEEEAPSRGAVAEDEEQSVANDNEEAVAMEDVSLSRESMDKLLEAYREQWRRGEAALQALAQGKGDQVDISDLRNALLNLQSGIGDVVERIMVRETGEFAAIDEDQALAFSEEGLEPAKDIQQLEDELKRVEMALQHLRTAVESGDEELSPAAAIEESQDDIEAPLRGE